MTPTASTNTQRCSQSPSTQAQITPCTPGSGWSRVAGVCPQDQESWCMCSPGAESNPPPPAEPCPLHQQSHWMLHGLSRDRQPALPMLIAVSNCQPPAEKLHIARAPRDWGLACLVPANNLTPTPQQSYWSLCMLPQGLRASPSKAAPLPPKKYLQPRPLKHLQTALAVITAEKNYIETTLLHPPRTKAKSPYPTNATGYIYQKIKSIPTKAMP